MDFMNIIIYVSLGFLGFIVLGYLFMVYNGLVLVRNNINKAWANIDVLLKQRHDEIPKLIKVCEGYMKHERDLFDKVLKSREALLRVSGRPHEMGKPEGELEGSLKKLFALAENYPDLKAQSSFQQLQQRVSGLESDIADRREFYNESVNNYNIRIQSIPDVVLAKLLGMTTREMFQVAESDKQDVEISFKV